MDDFRVDTTSDGPVASVAVGGELDAATAPVLDEAIRKLDRDDLVREVTVDLGDVGFIDSSGLSVLVAAHKRLRARGVSLVIDNATPGARRLFAIAGLDTVLTIR